MNLSFHVPDGLAPYDEAADAQRSVDDARREIEDAIRRAHGEYRQAWTRYAPDEIVEMLDRIQRQTVRYAADAITRLDDAQAQLDAAARIDAGEVDADERSFTLRHRALNTLGYARDSIKSVVETAKSAHRLNAALPRRGR